MAAKDRRLRLGGGLWLVALFSLFVNLLALTGSLFMLQVYDRVLASRSEPTLVVLFALVIWLYAAMGILDAARARVGARIGARLQARLDEPVFRSTLDPPPKAGRQALTGLHDLEAVRKFLGSPVAFAAFDLPFAPIFFAAIFLLHPWLGWFAIGGGVVLLLVTLLNQVMSRTPSEVASRTSVAALREGEQIRTQADTVRGLGMTATALARWRRDRDAALGAEIALSDRNGGFGSATKALRMLLQSAMLGLGAWLAIHGELTAGGIIAGTILMGRALAPIEQIVGGWASLLRARKGWASLKTLLAAIPDAPPRTALPKPVARLEVRDVSVVPPGEGRPTLSRVSFDLEPGQGLGVIGESASGKSSLARALVGLWRPSMGDIRLGGARIDQYTEDALSRWIGYLPQDVALFSGTVAQNIARLAESPKSEDVIRAATLAGAHEMILGLPKGYDTPVGQGGARLSGGQRQRIGLARALFGDPVLVILDEPNSSLDAPGSEALNAAIRTLKSDGRSVLVMAHRPAAIAECDRILLLRAGQAAAFGPRDEVLRQVAANHAQIVPSPGPAAGPTGAGGASPAGAVAATGGHGVPGMSSDGPQPSSLPPLTLVDRRVQGR